MKLVVFLFVLLASLVVGCPRTPVVGPVFEFSDAGLDDAGKVCLRFRQLGCEEGWGYKRNGHCERVTRKIIETRITHMNVSCILAADSKEAVRACGQECQ